jgi:hypothetical protein
MMIFSIRPGEGEMDRPFIEQMNARLGSGPIKSTFAASKWPRYRRKMAAAGSNSACKGILFRDQSHFGVLRI